MVRRMASLPTRSKSISMRQIPTSEAFNHEIEFQALVRDLAGNVGFSDSDPAKPRFINALGDKDDDGSKHNALGVFSRHSVWLDEVDPYIISDKTGDRLLRSRRRRTG